MKHSPDVHRHRSIRLPGYDYTLPGAYFITICTNEKRCLFGEVIEGDMRLNAYGQIVQEEWLKTGTLRPNIELDVFSIMPNHVHGIIVLHDNRRVIARYDSTEHRPSYLGHLPPSSLPSITRAFKSAVTRRINEIRNILGLAIWQRGYYEHIIRNEVDLNATREYIQNNPGKWADDEENPGNHLKRR
jgi:putative transposase